MASAKRRGSRLALLFLDLDHFKPINDSLGHALGDEVLKTVAQRLSSAVREADTVSRYGGDEFLILLSEVSQPSDAELIAGKLIAAIAEPCRVGGHVLQLSASIGISLYPDDGEDIDLLIRKADNAMYRAKRHGPGSFALQGQAPADEPQRQAPDATPPLESTRAEPASAAQERRNAELREANERLVLAALGAQELQAAAERARQRQDELMALVTQELKQSARARAPGHGHARPCEQRRALAAAGASRSSNSRRSTCARLVGAVHDVAHAEAGTLKLEREDVDLDRHHRRGRVGLPGVDGRTPAALQRSAARRSGQADGRPGAAGTGRRQPARQRLQVHARRRRDPAVAGGGWTMPRC